jgi:hypothetical protein
MGTKRTGLQFDNHTSKAVVWGSIAYNVNAIADNELERMFVSPHSAAQQGDWVTLSGAMNLQSATYIDHYAEVWNGEGDTALKIVLRFSDGHEIVFDDRQANAFDTVDTPLPVRSEQTPGSDPLSNISVSYWTRHDIEQYGHGMVTYTLTETIDTKDWMSRLPNRTTLALNRVTLPGTHDSGTWPLSGNAQCQTLSLEHQLEAGVRFIDVRLQLGFGLDWGLVPAASDLSVYHGEMDTGLTYAKDFILPCAAYLDKHPGETIVMLVSRNQTIPEKAAEKLSDSVAATRAQAFTQYANALISTAPGAFFLYPAPPVLGVPGAVPPPPFPTLAQTAGKIVLVTRYPGGAGIPLLVAPDDDIGRKAEDGRIFDIQDVYGYGFTDGSSIADKLDKKWGFIKDQLDGALAETAANAWRINYASASGPPGLLNPVDFAKGADGAQGMNTRLSAYLSQHPKGYYGAVLMDYPEYPAAGALIRQLIETNP